MEKPQSNASCPLGADFDHASAEFRDAVPEVFVEIHRDCPVIKSEQHEGFTYFSRYEDVTRIAKDWETFSSHHDLGGHGSRKGIMLPAFPSSLSFLEMDPPAQRDYRTAFARWFSPKAISAYESRLREIVVERLKGVLEMGDFDVVDDLANPIAAISTLDFIGLPIDEWQIYADPIHRQTFIIPGDPEHPRLITETEIGQARALEVIRSRREEPREDLVSLLVTTEINGALLTDEQVVKTIWVTLGGGFDTTSSTMAFMMQHLSKNPDVLKRLAADKKLIASAIEEYIRYFSPASNTARTATKDVVVGGTNLKDGDRVLLGWRAANFDGEQFDEPHRLRLDRTDNRHLGFGDGPHRCAGSRFARIELRVFLEELPQRLPGWVVDEDGIVPFPSAGIVNGFVNMPASIV